MQRDEDDQPLSENDFPRPEDMDDEDDDGTFPCQFCKKPIYEDSEWCPHCGKYLSREEKPFNTSLWIGIMIVIFLVAMGMVVMR